jgi:hypothetical protein
MITEVFANGLVHWLDVQYSTPRISEQYRWSTVVRVASGACGGLRVLTLGNGSAASSSTPTFGDRATTGPVQDNNSGGLAAP